MIEIEQYLYKYQDAERRKKSLLLDLTTAIRMKDEAYIPPNMAVNPKLARVQKSNLDSQVERIVAFIIDKYWDDIERVEEEIDECDRVINQVHQIMREADLTEDERLFVKYRYFEEHSNQKINELLHVGDCKRKWIRTSALGKLQGPYEAICGRDSQSYGESGGTA